MGENIRLHLLRLLLRQRSWLYNPRSAWSHFYLACLGSVAGQHLKTFDFEKALPPLPVPALGQTCAKYLQTVRPLLTDQEFERTLAVVTDFMCPGGIGDQSQAMLLARAKERPNWVVDWWEEVIYLTRRESLVINPSWYVLAPPSAGKTPFERAALFVSMALKFKKMLETQTLEPQRLYGVAPLSMRMFSRLFSTTRIPGQQKDSLVAFSPEESKHIVVIHRHQIYWFNVYDEDGRALSVPELVKQFETVVRLSDGAAGFDWPVGVLTTDNRARWAQVRQKLVDVNCVNRDSLNLIERALLVVCLDDTSPSSLDELAWIALCGNGRNRWFGKSLQVIVQQNGELAINVEHGCVDGTVGVCMFDFIIEGEDTQSESASSEMRPLPPVNKIRWKVTPEIEQAIACAGATYDRLAADLGLKVFAFEHFGQDWIKKHRLSPDSFIQMAIQLAYYKIHGKFVLTWEPAHMRLFYYGRTETIRTCSIQSVAFVTATRQADCPAETRFRLLQEAIETHALKMRESMDGQGIDRHLLGLRMVALEAGLELHAIFTDPAYHIGWTLSTSHVPMKNGLGMGIGPETHDGYYVGYSMLKDRVLFHITSYKSCTETDPARFARVLEQSLLEMQELCRTGCASL